MTCRQRRKLFAPAESQRIADNEERAGMLLHKRCEGDIDLIALVTV